MMRKLTALIIAIMLFEATAHAADGDLIVNGVAAMGKTFTNVLKIGPLATAPSHFYINTKIPFTDIPEPQIEIKGYNHGGYNKLSKFTVSWYVYQGAFYWTQYKSDIGYYNPPRIRLGTYDDAGTTRIRLEISNTSIYWSSFFISALDIYGSSSMYSGWTYALGEMPSGTGNITTVPQYPGFVFNSSGNVGIGTADPGSYKLYVAGNAYTTGSWSGSDVRLKKNMKSLEGALSLVRHLQAVKYDWRTDEFKEKNLDAGRQIGLIAQDVEKIIPELVKTDNDGYKAISYEKLTAVLVEAVKEQGKRIDDLESQIAKLKMR